MECHYEIWRDNNAKLVTCGEFHSAMEWLIAHAKGYSHQNVFWIDTMAGSVITLQVTTPAATTFYRIIKCEERGRIG